MSSKFTLEDVIRHQKQHGFGPVLVTKPHENNIDHRGLGTAQSEPPSVPALEDQAGPENVHLEEAPRRHRVRITMYRKKLLDPDNSYAAVKELLDGIKASGLIHDDSADWLELDVKQELAKPNPVKTVIEIEEIP